MSERVSALEEALTRAQARLTALLEGVEREELLYIPPGPGEWSAAEVLAHIAEMEPFWMRKCLAMRERPDVVLQRATPEEQRARLAAVETYGKAPLAHLRARLEEAHRAALGMLRELGEADLDRTGHRPPDLTLTVEEAVRRFVIQHLEEHTRQVAEALASARRQGPGPLR